MNKIIQDYLEGQLAFDRFCLNYTFSSFSRFLLKLGWENTNDLNEYYTVWHSPIIDERQEELVVPITNEVFRLERDLNNIIKTLMSFYDKKEYQILDDFENSVKDQVKFRVKSEMSIYSFSPFGYEGSLVCVEVDLRRGIPAVDIVGLADSAVKESRERVQCAIRNSGIQFPAEHVLISLSPADLKKDGAGFDLPLAIAIIKEQYHLNIDESIFTMGELELGGNTRPVRAMEAGLSTAMGAGIKYAIMPYGVDKKAIPQGMHVRFVKNLNEVYYTLQEASEGNFRDFNEETEIKSLNDEIRFTDVDEEWGTPLDSIEGMNGLKWAMAVAAAGRHNLMAWGAPGCGKTMTLQCMPQLLPRLTASEIQSVQRIYSIAGLLSPNKDVPVERPFRMPHQTASIEGICGGGPNCRPGEITLAHNGVLFLDEAAEFRTSALQMLRVPLENHTITLSRAGRTTVYPANFQLVMAVNPCPCGNYGNKEKICLCSAKSVELYWNKFSGPLLDRVDIRFSCDEEDNTPPLSLEILRSAIKGAWEKQLKRQGKLNAELGPEEIEQYIKLDKLAEQTLTRYASENELSPRAVASLKKLARTIEDMALGNEEVCDVSMNRAISLRKNINCIPEV